MSAAWNTLLALALLVSCAWRAARAEEVVVLTDDNFDELTGQGAWFVKFYAPWCGHCKSLAPTWQALSDNLEGSGVRVGKVDCTVHKTVGSRFGVRGYPSLKFLNKGHARDYKGGRNLKSLQDFAESMSGAPIELAEDNTQRIATIAQDGVAFVYYGPSGDAAFEQYESVAVQFQGLVSFFHTEDADTLDRLGVPMPADNQAQLTIVSQQAAEQRPVLSAGEFTAAAVEAFVTQHRWPLVTSLDQFTFQELVDTGRPVVVGLAFPDNTEEHARFRTELYDAAGQPAMDAFMFGLLDAHKWKRWLERYGFEATNGADGFPTVFVFNGPDAQYWTAEKAEDAANPAAVSTSADIVSFLKRVSAGAVPVQGSQWYHPSLLLRRADRLVVAYVGEDNKHYVVMGLAMGVALLLAVCLIVCIPDESHPVPPAQQAQEPTHAAAEHKTKAKQAAKSKRSKKVD